MKNLIIVFKCFVMDIILATFVTPCVNVHITAAVNIVIRQIILKHCSINLSLTEQQIKEYSLAPRAS